MNTDRQLQIAAHAHSLWDNAGRPEGQAERFWFEAEQVLKESEQSSDATELQLAEPKPAKPGKAAKLV